MDGVIFLMRDVVDNQILDVDGRRVTKVAGVEAELRPAVRPVVVALLVGPGPLSRRFGRRIAGAAGWVASGRRTVRIPWDAVSETGPDVRLRVSRDVTGATHAEDVARRLIRFIPSLKRSERP